MSDKHDIDSCASAEAFFALPEHRVVALEGRDAASFAQAQFINDVNALQPRQWQWSGWLTPKGRAVALFALIRLGEESIRLLVADADAQALVEALLRFRFRSKVEIGLRADLYANGAFAMPDRASGNAVGHDDGSLVLDMGGDGGARCLRIASAPAPAATAEAARWRLFDLEHGWPRLDAAQLGHWTPQQLSLERLRGFSVKKGCYPGQEIVARTHFLGKAKRGLALLESDSMPVAGAEVRGGAAALGNVVATAAADGRHLALAVMPLERQPAALDIGGIAAREIPLKDGLAR